MCVYIDDIFTSLFKDLHKKRRLYFLSSAWCQNTADLKPASGTTLKEKTILKSLNNPS